jgi:hypothetical protein
MRAQQCPGVQDTFGVVHTSYAKTHNPKCHWEDPGGLKKKGLDESRKGVAFECMSHSTKGVLDAAADTGLFCHVTAKRIESLKLQNKSLLF